MSRNQKDNSAFNAFERIAKSNEAKSRSNRPLTLKEQLEAEKREIAEAKTNKFRQEPKEEPIRFGNLNYETWKANKAVIDEKERAKGKKARR